MFKMLVSASIACFVLALAIIRTATAERSDSLRPTVFAIKDARVVAAPGQVLPKATVVIRDGLIEAVGADVPTPADALVIDGKGLTVYPGFLDALSHWGFDAALRRSEVGAAAAEDFASEALAATKPDNRKGMTPEFQVSTALKPDDEQADNWRRLGFTAHLIAPEGGMIVGQSALVSLSARPPREAVLRSPVAQHLAFRPIGGSDYPRVLMGVIAHCRQTLLDAGHYQRLHRAYEATGRVGRRPPLDPALADLSLALDGKQPVVFEADSRDDIHRALDFAEEFKLRPILYGGRAAWKATVRLKQTHVPIILRLDFSDSPMSGRRRGSPGTRQGAGPEAENPPPKRVRDDRERQMKEEQHNAALLHEQGVRFSFSTAGQTGDKPWEKFRDNLRKAIAAGLPPEAALRALTTDAAHILGVEKQLGTIAPRKAAHLVVMDGDFHEAATQVRYVFADGVRFEYETKPKAAKAESKTDKPAKPAKTDKTVEAKSMSRPPRSRRIANRVSTPAATCCCAGRPS